MVPRQKVQIKEQLAAPSHDASPAVPILMHVERRKFLADGFRSKRYPPTGSDGLQGQKKVVINDTLGYRHKYLAADCEHFAIDCRNRSNPSFQCPDNAFIVPVDTLPDSDKLRIGHALATGNATYFRVSERHDEL